MGRESVKTATGEQNHWTGRAISLDWASDIKNVMDWGTVPYLLVLSSKRQFFLWLVFVRWLDVSFLN